MNAGIMAASGILTAYGLFESRRSPEIKKVLIPIKNLPDDLSGFTIAQITDIHVSPTIKRDWVKIIVDKVNRLSPDIIAFTGDLADGSVERLQNDVAPLSDLEAKYGKYFVTGNHEYYSGINRWINEIKRLGFTVLINEHRIIRHGKARIFLGGVTDYKGGQFYKSHASSPKAAIEGALPSDIKLLLAHQPKNIFSAAKAGFDLQISGHTHGGQFFPWNYVVCLDQPFVSGLHKFKNTQIYVNNGTGYWGPPLRLGVPSEITLLQLTVS